MFFQSEWKFWIESTHRAIKTHLNAVNFIKNFMKDFNRIVPCLRFIKMLSLKNKSGATIKTVFYLIKIVFLWYKIAEETRRWATVTTMRLGWMWNMSQQLWSDNLWKTATFSSTTHIVSVFQAFEDERCRVEKWRLKKYFVIFLNRLLRLDNDERLGWNCQC